MPAGIVAPIGLEALISVRSCWVRGGSWRNCEPEVAEYMPHG